MNKTVRVSLNEIELSIILQCIQSLNFSGQHVIPVGILGDKIQRELAKFKTTKNKEIINESAK